MMKKSVLILASLGLFVATALPAFAETPGTVESISKRDRAIGTTTAATASVATTAKIACVGTAVNTREAALAAAMATFTSAQNAAYTARSVALKSAYALTTAKEVRNAVKTAWSTFNTSQKVARKAWQTASKAAWMTYRKAAQSCKAPKEISDSENFGSEVSGN
jgi:hypothetical protein